MANKQKKKQKKAQNASNGQQAAQRQPTNEAGQVIEFQFGGDTSPPPSRQARRAPRAEIHTRDTIVVKLSEAGYHRARVMYVTPYDKIIGGIVWAMYMFESSPRGKQWYFKEHIAKSDREMARECAQILVVKEDIGYRQPISTKDLLEVKADVLGPFVDFLLARISNDTLSKEKFDFFKTYFGATFESRENAIYVFLETLHRWSDNRNCELVDSMKFDYSILRDEYATGKIILYEYIHYALSGNRLYPAMFETNGPMKFAERKRPEDIKTRAQLDSYADEAVVRLDDETVMNIAYVANLIDHFRFAYKLNVFECRFLDEASAYHKMNHQYRAFATAFAFFGDTVDEIVPLEADAMQKTIDAILQRWIKLEKAQLVELAERKKRAANLRQNHDEYDPEVYWDPDNCEKANQMEKENDKFEKFIENTKNFPNNLVTVHYAFQSFCEKREHSVPKEMEHGNFGLIPFVDDTLAEDIKEVIDSLPAIIADMEASLDPVECQCDADHRHALTVYLVDCNNLLIDWYWKAKIIMDARTELCEKFKDLKMQTKLSQHKLYYAEKETSLLMRLNQLVRENEKELREREKLNLIFNVDWNKKKEKKATREAADAAAAELKRQQALEAARVAKQARHAKNGNGKKGASGKKGRNGARR